MNFWSSSEIHRKILFLMCRYGSQQTWNHKIGRDYPLSCLCGIKFFRCHRASFSWFADFSRRHRSRRAGTNIWRDFSSSPLPFRSTPRWIVSSDPSFGEFPLLVTSFSAGPAPALFPRPAGMLLYPLLALVITFLSFLITFWYVSILYSPCLFFNSFPRLCCLVFSSFVHVGILLKIILVISLFICILFLIRNFSHTKS